MNDHYVKEIYGTANFTDADQYALLLLKVVAGDGIISDAEWDYFVGFAKATGASAEEIEAWKRLDYESADLPTMVKQYRETTGAVANDFIYDAIKMSSADGYADQEKAALRAVAEAGGIPEYVVGQIENLCLLEETVRQLRISLLFPEGSAFHHSEAKP